ncbi:probable cyclin-dependent serine/threonine-protein kinase DDB_G0278487 [Drosophila innubila]|uniref:probable cyclin-dependent serine/threonine-protein kinase DDB_G0278487 n=1 Tax=Drosophila innubila TaxID=198719 RepID=UPI00148E354B|nr:probable cyclin-dependent serine/threonine-protein kinase DDB_G0278487 [Drosophila innubila]
MHVTEFLTRTNRRNVNSQINYKVQQKLEECLQDLENRRRQLAEQLQREERRLSEEIKELLKGREDAAQNERIEWIQMALIKREQEEEELIKKKQQQREIENSEEHRHMETKQILLDTKQAQLYQIEERRERRLRAAYMDKQWQFN